MNKPFVKLSQEVKEAIAKKLQSAEVKEMLQKEEGTDYGRFKMIISTNAKDRSGEIVDQSGWELDHYKNNPVVLWGHDYNLMPVGVTDSIYLNDKDQLIAEGRWAPTAFAQELRQLYDAKILHAASVGFIVKEMEGKTITRGELIEWSFVSVPANPEAISLLKEMGADVEGLKSKGLLELETKEGEVVDNNELEAEETPADESEVDVDDTQEPQDEPGEAETPEDDKEPVETPETPPEGENEEKTAGFEYNLDLKTGKALSAEAQARIEAALKGAIEDELAFDWDEYEKKWDNIDLIEPVIYTFYDVYFRNSVQASEFPALVAEMIYLLQKKVEESKEVEKSALIEEAEEKDYTNEIVKTMVRVKEEAKLSQKVGAKLQEMQNEIDDSIVTRAQEILAIIDEDTEMDEKKAKLHEVLNTWQKEVSSVGDEPEGEDTPEGTEQEPEGKEERSEDAGSPADEVKDEDTKALDDYLEMQKVLRAVATATTKSLEKVGKAIKSERKKQ